ncbi:MAG: protein TolQ [Sneathiellaceae bacterium]
MSIWTLFFEADIVVKLVMIGLLFASVWVWAIVFEKLFRFRRVNREADAFEQEFWSGGSLEDLYDRIAGNPGHPQAALFAAAMREWRRSAERGLVRMSNAGSLKERIEQVMQVTRDRELTRLEKQLGVLATIGSTAPFVGLFGTVWGIMNAFTSIAASQNTSLAVVAPGIAEALFATALGLLAAIPAVVAYNKLNGDLDRYAGRLEGFSGEFGAILSRQLDEEAVAA